MWFKVLLRMWWSNVVSCTEKEKICLHYKILLQVVHHALQYSREGTTPVNYFEPQRNTAALQVTSPELLSTMKYSNTTFVYPSGKRTAPQERTKRARDAHQKGRTKGENSTPRKHHKGESNTPKKQHRSENSGPRKDKKA